VPAPGTCLLMRFHRVRGVVFGGIWAVAGCSSGGADVTDDALADASAADAIGPEGKNPRGGEAGGGGAEASVDGGALDAEGELDAPPSPAPPPPYDGGLVDAGNGCAIPTFITDLPAPIGWASTEAGTTGGGGATPTVVTDLDAFNAAAAGTSPAVIYVKGKLKQGTVTIGSNKTIIGCSGDAALNGHVDLKNSTNVIVRNISVVGYNCAPPDVDVANKGECQNGQDAITIQKSQRIWFDHDAISDGSDGNLDIVHASDLITVSYTKFFYSTARTDPNDTGAAGHRFSSLIGGSDSNGDEDTGHLRITFHHDWWAQNVVERMPRIRFGQVHLFDNLWTAAGNDYCVGIGVGANVLLEDNVFSSVKTPIDTTSFVKASVAPSAVRSRDNVYTATNGDAPADLSAGSVFTPPYTYALQQASAVQAAVQSGAGPH
jgi:pectate lyase